MAAEPPALGQRVELEISDLAFGGEGVARLRELVVFVPFVIPGEKVEVELVELKKNFARARLIRVLEPSTHRVNPQCPYFTDCGGCQYQHLDYHQQTLWKRKQIADLFLRIGKFDPTLVAPVEPCPQPYGYRNRIMIRSQWNKPEQRLNIGFIRHDNRLVVDIDHCPISEPELSEQIKAVRKNPPPKGGIKVVLRIHPENWEIPRDSFFQNNFFLLPKLVEKVRNCLVASNSQYVIDAYCGVGFFGIEVANLVRQVVGVELDNLAIKSARKNAQNRNLTNCEFITARTEELLPNLLQKFPANETTVILDPPRTGCFSGSLKLLREVRPNQIIYVSCHPATLARDLNVLCEDGVFKLVQVYPLDMFPQTQHVECVADLRLNAHEPS